MRVYRITKSEFINDVSGAGARQYGGRWNHKGTGLIYTSETRSLAAVEYLVHVPSSIKPSGLSIVTLEIPDTISYREISQSDLPDDWRNYPAPLILADIGTDWAMKNHSLLLRVPSAVIPYELNYLINPSHPDMKHVSIFQVDKYTFDSRLILQKRD